MQNKERILHLDICDYRKRKICPLYSSGTDVSGQATDIIRITERNGWKELSFHLPSVCMSECGTEENYRLEHLKAGFLIRAIDDKETDWYIISEPKIQHNAYSKTAQVTAGHVSQLLKLKNLGLEFSDEEGNNVGTAEELLTTILAGTGWKVGYVYQFAEKNGDPKRRSLKASAKTGAFKLISMMCELFDAKPIFHGDERTVDIVPINPFSEPDPGKVPDLELANEVVELHYGKNVSNVTRAQNTDNIVTKLYAYGSYGDKTSGYCGIDECTHVEYEFTLTKPCTAGTTYYFIFTNHTDVELAYHFTPTADLQTGDKLIYSLLDPSSMLYIWDDNHQNAYPVYKGTKGDAIQAAVECVAAKNWFQFIMNFDYYRAIGLMDDGMVQQLGEYQREAPVLYQKVVDASQKMSESQTKLSKTIGYIDFCKLDVKGMNDVSNDGYIQLILDKDNTPDGVIYRSDYDKNKYNRFKWRVTESLNTDGDPINAAAGLLYIIHDTTPVTWDKAYLKELDDEKNPTLLTLWAAQDSIDFNFETDQIFLFAYNGINGRLGTLESNDESAVMSLNEALRVVTVDHPVVFVDSTVNPLITAADVNGYGWLWQYDPTGQYSSCMYFANEAHYDKTWKRVYFQDSNNAGAEEHSYWFNWRDSTLYRRDTSEWIELDTAADRKIAELFSTVFMLCKARDRYYQGVSENYVYTVGDGQTLPAGNYFFENEYNSYWAFTTTETLSSGDTLTYNYDNAWVTQIRNKVESSLKPRGYRFDNVNYHPSNILKDKGVEVGTIDDKGNIKDDDESYRSQSFISVVPLTKYNIVDASDCKWTIHYYDDKYGWLSSKEADDSFDTPVGCTYIRFSINSSDGYSNAVISADNKSNIIVIEDLNYIKLDTNSCGEKIGLITQISAFKSLATDTYDTNYQALKTAQEKITDSEQTLMEVLGDIYREGWWSDASYVDGDENKLYEDALDNLNEIAKPEATYAITFLDLRDANTNYMDYGAADETMNVSWPDLNDTDAVHLVDPEIGVNAWAFIDKIQKCYDKPWQTKITINTKLSTIAQHSFTDVMTNIANVASDMKGKASYYEKTLSTSASNDDIIVINAELNKSERELLSAMSKTDEYIGFSTTSRSQIKQTADMISSEVMRATLDSESKMRSETQSLVKQTADTIVNEVSRTYAPSSSAISKVQVLYCLSDSNETWPDDVEWSASITEDIGNKFIWTKTVTTYVDTNKDDTESTPVCVVGIKGKRIDKVENFYIATDTQNTCPDIKDKDWQDVLPTEVNQEKPYIWNYEKVTYTNKESVSSVPCMIGTHIKSIEEQYGLSNAVDVEPTKWDSAPPSLTSQNKFLWNREKITYIDNDTSYSSPMIIGAKGDDGKTYYTWIKYADTPTTGMCDEPEGKKYLGLALNKTSQTESTSYEDYTWSLIKGEDGQPGEPGDDGKTYYTWIKYADDVNGTNMDDDPTDKYYIGIGYNKESSTESTNASDYVWSLFRGANGAPGDPGVGISSVKAQYYLSTSKTDRVGGKWQDEMPTWEPGKYVWTRTEITYTDGRDPTYTEPYCDSSWEAVNEIGKVWFQDRAPSNPGLHDLWIDTTEDEHKPKRWDGQDWISASDTIAVKAETGIKQTKESISSIVSLGAYKDETKLDYANSVLQQTLNSFSSQITGKDLSGNPATSSLKQTVDGLSGSVQTLNESSIISQTAETIQAIVSGKNLQDGEENENEFKTSSVSISKDGVAISTGGTFTVDSGNFDIDENGKLSATNAFLSGTVYSDNYPVMKNGYDIIVSSVEPSSSLAHQGMIWIKPGVPTSSGGSSGGSSGDSTSITTGVASYSAYNSVGSRVSIIDSSTYDHSYRDGFEVTGTGFAASASKYTYTISLPLFIRYGGEGYKGGGDVTVTLSNGSQELSTTQFVSVNKSSGNFSGAKTFTITSSSIWLGNVDTLYVYAEVASVSGYWRANVMDNSGTVTVTCAAS